MKRVGLSIDQPPKDKETWQKFIERVQRAYQDSDQERYLIERSLEISSREMQELYQDLQKVSANQLSVERNKLTAVISALGAGLCLLDLEGKVQSINPEGARLLGWDPCELPSSLQDLEIKILKPDELLDLKEILLKEAGEGRPFEAREALIQTREGKLLPIGCKASSLREGDRIVGVVLVFFDRTEAKQIEAELAEARDAAVKAAEMKTEFLANMSHEIRTPMNGVIGLTSLLLETELTEEQLGYTQTLKNCADTLLSIINGILDLAKIESGKIQLECVPLDLQETFEDVAELLSSVAQEKGLDLICSVDPELPEKVYGDPMRIRQILTNLVGNALKFTEEGFVLLEARALDVQHDTVRVQINVEDTGVGIPENRLAAIFDSFTQVDGSTTRRFGGTGLGLTISKQFVELMGGRIWVESEIGLGSNFFIEMELDLVDAGQPGRRLPTSSLQGFPVAIVEAIEPARESIGNSLQHWGCQVQSGASLREVGLLSRPWMPARKALLLSRPLRDLEDLRLDFHDRTSAGLGHVPAIYLLPVGETLPESIPAEWNIQGWLNKPIRSGLLCKSLLEVAGNLGASHHASSPLDVPNQEATAGKLSLLLVEDNPINRKVATRILQKAGHEVRSAENGSVALDMVREHSFDLVFMDIQMPVLDGFEATAEIRGWGGEWKKLPIIAMTAHAMTGYREKCLTAGMNDYISKPLRREELEALLERWIAWVENRRRRMVI